MLKNSDYSKFFTITKYGSMKWIMLNNDFRNTLDRKEKFVVLSPNTYKLLIQENDNLLAKYTIFIKYMCGIHGGNTDFTAN